MLRTTTEEEWKGQKSHKFTTNRMHVELHKPIHKIGLKEKVFDGINIIRKLC